MDVVPPSHVHGQWIYMTSNMTNRSSHSIGKELQGQESSNRDLRMLLYEEWVLSHPSVVDPLSTPAEDERSQSHIEFQSIIHHGQNYNGKAELNRTDHRQVDREQQINTLILQQISLHYHSTHGRIRNPERNRTVSSSISLGSRSPQKMSSSMADAFFQDYPDCCQLLDDDCCSTTSTESNREVHVVDASNPMTDCVYIQTVCPKDAAMGKQPKSEATRSKEEIPRRISPTSIISTTEGPSNPKIEPHTVQPNTSTTNPYSHPTHSNMSSEHISHYHSKGPAVNPYSNGYGMPRPKSRESSTIAHASWDEVQAQNPFQTAREVGMFQSREPPPVTNPHASWDEIQAQNPFQTAREVARNPPPPSDPAPTSNGHPYQHHHPSELGPTCNANPYKSVPPPPVPIIRESLKRKFQPPVRRDPTHHTAVNSNGPSSNTLTRPRSSTNKAPPAKDDDPSNDLPEELQMYGAELVAKIENEIMDQTDPITFDDIAGLHEQKQTVYEIVCWPMKRPDLFTGLRAAPNGLLLYGPPGTGKTLIGKAIAHESGATFFSISSSSLTSKWIGEGEKLVRVLFAVAAYRQPAVVFIDEIDSLLTQRKSDENEASRRIKTEFLIQLDGTGTSGQGRVLLIGATNRPQELDEAARRRFTKRLYVPLPECPDREALVRVLLKTNAHGLSDAEIQRLALDTDGFSGADLKALCTDAAMGPIRQLGAHALDTPVSEIPPITYKHFRQALRRMKPSVSPQDLIQYIEWDQTYGSSKRADDETHDEDSDDDEPDGKGA